MKNSFETETTRNGKMMRRLAGLVGCGLVAIMVWTACDCMADRIAAEVRHSRTSRNCYLRIRAEVKYVISVVNYFLTPEDDLGAIACYLGNGQSIMPFIRHLVPAGTAGVSNGIAAMNPVDRPAAQ